jgi:hypothetical protein
LDRDDACAAVGIRPAVRGVYRSRLSRRDTVKIAACSDERVGSRPTEVTQFVRPMSSLLVPQIISRVVVATIRRPIKQERQQASSHGIRLMPPGAP